MKEKLKIIFIPLVVSLVGIVLILGSWLYGSYSRYLENTVSTAERVLFDAVQEFAQERVSDGNENGAMRTPLFEKRLHEELVKTYPNVSADSLSEMMKRVRLTMIAPIFRPDRSPTRPQPPFPRHLLPEFLFNKLTLDSASYNVLHGKISDALRKNGIEAGFELTFVTLDDGNFLNEDGYASTLTPRPLLIDGEQGKFLALTLQLPWLNVMYNLSWQLIISVFLVVTILGCFVYLFQTISKQNKLATLRKTFVNHMAHELRTPVATVYAIVQALQSYTNEQEQDNRAAFHRIAREELERLSDMIDHVLQVAVDDDASRKQLNYEYMDMEALIAKCIARVHTGVEDLDIQFIHHQATTKCLLWADRLHLGNVLTNLLENAAKYGSKSIEITTRELRNSGFLEITVTDDGMGIPAVYHERIFDPFFRVPSGSSSPHTRGFGLGLAYVKQIIGQHKGTIKLESQQGSGTTFTIKIPKNPQT